MLGCVTKMTSRWDVVVMLGCVTKMTSRWDVVVTLGFCTYITSRLGRWGHAQLRYKDEVPLGRLGNVSDYWLNRFDCLNGFD